MIGPGQILPRVTKTDLIIILSPAPTRALYWMLELLRKAVGSVLRFDPSKVVCPALIEHDQILYNIIKTGIVTIQESSLHESIILDIGSC